MFVFPESMFITYEMLGTEMPSDVPTEETPILEIERFWLDFMVDSYRFTEFAEHKVHIRTYIELFVTEMRNFSPMVCKLDTLETWYHGIFPHPTPLYNHKDGYGSSSFFHAGNPIANDWAMAELVYEFDHPEYVPMPKEPWAELRDIPSFAQNSLSLIRV